jgi:hypothetical protein
MPFMKSIATRVAGFAVGMLVVMFIFHSERFRSFWWQAYSDPGGSFSLKFPSTPSAAGKQVTLETGGTAVMKMVAATPNQTTAYIFTYYDGPGSPGKTVEEKLNLARDDFISGAHGALLDEQHLQIAGHQARDIQARSSQNSVFNLRLIADGQRLVVLEVETVGQTFDSKSVQKFFDSLKLSN